MLENTQQEPVSKTGEEALKMQPILQDAHVKELREKERRDPIVDTIERRTGAHTTQNHVEIHRDGPEAFSVLEQQIMNARRDIHINIYCWSHDSTGERIANLIIRKAKQGVNVTIQVDLLGTYLEKPGVGELAMLSGSLMFDLVNRFTADEMKLLGEILVDPSRIYELPVDKQEMLQKSIMQYVTRERLFAINPTLRRLSQYESVGLRLNVRANPLNTIDHSKVYIFDRTTVFSGDMNIGDEYSGGYHPQNGWNGTVHPSHWKGYMALMRGPGSTLYRNHFFNRNDAIPNANARQGETTSVTVLRNSNRPTGGAATNRERQITFAVHHLIQTAQSEILVEHAYIMDEQVVKLLNEASQRGVRVRIMRSLPESATIERINDRFFAMLRQGPNMRVYQSSRILHTKLLCVDNRYTIMGSANLTPESMNLHGEAAMLFVNNRPGRELTEALSKQFDELEYVERMRLSGNARNHHNR